MDRRNIGRLGFVSVIVGTLLAGFCVNAGTAAVKTGTTYADADCDVIQNIQVDDASGGYWGKTATNASKAFMAAAVDIEDKKLKKAMNTLADVWGRVGKKRSVTAAAAITAKAGKRYGNALGVYTKAQIACSMQGLDSSLDETSTSEPSSPD